MPSIVIGLIEMPASSRIYGARELLDRVAQHGAVLGALLELDAGVEVLGVLAHDHEVDVAVARAHAGVALARAHLREQVERLAQRDVDRAEAGADRRRDRALDRDARVRDRLDHGVGQRIAAVLGHDVGARLADVPVELDSGGLEDAAGGFGELGADPVAGDQCDAMRHARQAR